MAENLRDALRDFALKKMRDLEAERSNTSKKDESMASKSPKSTKIKINRDTSKLISGSSKKTEDLETFKSESKERTKRHHGESSSGNSNKIQKLMKLYEQDASNAATLKGQDFNASQLEGSAPLKTTHVLANIEAEPPKPDVKMTKKDSKSTMLLKKEPSKAEPHFKALPLGKNMESDGDVVTEKKSVPMLGEKKTIKINIQTKLLALPQKSEKVIVKESDSDSRSSSDGDDSSDSDDENQIADGLPWRTILEDGELSPSSDEAEEEGEEEERGGEEDVKETSGNSDKTIEEKEKEVLEIKGKDKRSSKHKHKSKHKKHKHKKSKKKKSKHKRKDKQEKESSCVKNADHGANGGVEEVDVEQKGEKASSSKKRSKEQKQKESMQDSKEKKGKSSSSSSRRTSEEREAKGLKPDETLKDVKDIRSKSSERKEKSRSHGSRSSSKEKHAKDAMEVFKKSEPDLSVETGRRKHDIDKKEKADSKHEKGSKSNEKMTNRESLKEIEKIEDDVKSVHLSKEIERSIKVIELKRIELEEECRNVTGSNKKAKEEMSHAKTNSRKSDSNEETGTEQAGPNPSHAGGSISITLSSIKDTPKTQKDGKSNSSHKIDKQRHESKSKEESRQREDSRNRHKTEEGKKDSKHDESSSEDRRKDDKRHKEKRKDKDKEDKKRHSRKNQVATKVKIDHLEHDFPSAEEYADVSGSMDSAEKKDDVKSDTSTPGESELSEIKSRIEKPVEAVLLKVDEVKAENTDNSKERVNEGKGPVDSTNEQVDVTTENNTAVVSDSEKKSPFAEKCDVVQDRLTLAKDAAKRPSEEKKDIADSPTPDKDLDIAGSQVENTSIAKAKTSEVDKSNKEGKTSENSEHVGSGDKKNVASKIGKKEKRADSTSSSTEKTEKSNKSESGEKEMDAKDVKKDTDRTSKKRKKEKADDKEEGAVDSEIEEGEIVKKHKKSKKKDKKKDKSEKDRSDRDKSEHRERRRSRYSDSRSESHSHSRSHKRHKGSRSKSRSDDGSDSDISIGKPKMVEKSYFSESRGCWVTRMVPKEDDSSSDPDDGDEPYDIGDTFIRHPAHDRRSVFDRLGSGSSSRRGHFNDRYDRHSRYGYSRRRGRSYSRSRSRSRSRSPKFKIDKKKLLEIAKANALQRMRAGELPANLPIPESIKKAADSYEVNESIQKFTERCKALANLQGGSSDDDSPVNRPVGSDEEDGDESQKPFVRHPFKVKEAGPIVLNIKNAVQIPVGGKDTLRVQFPVSSGSQHRKKEEEIIIANANDPYGQWTAVEKPKPKPDPKPPAAPTTKASTTTTPQPPTPATGPAAAPATTPATQTTPAITATPPASVTSAAAAAPAGPYVPGVTNIQPPKPVAEEDRVFEDAPGFSYDIGQIVSARLKAARALQSNPNNVEALTVLHHSQKQIRTWAHSSKKPGLFTGSTDATFLRPEQLSNPNRKNQAWIKKDMFLTAAPVNTDIGRSLMHKMGWKQGEGLGKNKEGALNPLLLEIKTDRQGLVAAAEKPKKKGDVSKVIRKDLSGKHPVMALNELCNKKRWGKPNFEVVREDGPAHRKNFVFKVRIRNEEYISTVPSANKKDAKALAATVALQKMGLLMS
ncbi:ankyrin repeat domain-containing protein 11-like isoform X1 [Lytechinus pictus]|uniref:ankyrin repeat domain-containing protein 11-like isoform X1 n=1 Tax=Lytechinus pictus TaxID=7653 RepID=UPI0030B9AE1E